MATYTNDTFSTTNPFGTRKNANTPAGFDTYITTRWFGNFITDGTVALADIASVTLGVSVEGTVGGGLTDVTLYWDTTDGWGSTVGADYATFTSTYETLVAHNISWTSTGSKTITIDKNTLNLNGNNWFRLSCGSDEGTGVTKNVSIGTQDNATQSKRPVLTITLNSGAKLLTLLGVGGPGGAGGSTGYYGVSGDGFCRETAVVSTGVPYLPDNP